MDEIESKTAYVIFLKEGSKKKLKHPSRRFKKLLWTLVVLTFVATASMMYIFHSSRALLSPPVSKRMRFTTSSKPSFEKWTDDDFTSKFNSFVTTFGRDYANDTERAFRYNIFRNHMTYIEAHNQENSSYKLAVNQLIDLTDEEFSTYYANLKVPTRVREVDWSLTQVNETELPISLDWREKGCVTEVKDQQRCGSCWAFSTTGAIEGAICARIGVLPDLSEQQLVDCGGPEGNYGCDGGEVDWGFQYVLDNRGICQEQVYPYKAHLSSHCKARECRNAVSIQDFRDVPPHNELAVRAAIVKYGPISIAIDADEPAFRFYKSGVFSAPCGVELNHAVLLVGYGEEELITDEGEEFFILKNSWGTTWGDNGYMRIKRTPDKSTSHHKKYPDGQCGLLLQSSFVVA